MIDIDAEFEKFFEFPTADRSTVSSTSCKLFARHMIETARKASLTTDRERFEKIISKSPYELLINRYPNNHTSGWPDAYKDYKVQLCWNVCQDFAAPLHGEIARLTQCLHKANEQAERFEREWYLRGDEIEGLKNQLEPDQFWLHDDPENSFASTLENLVQEHADNCVNDPKDFVGYEFKVMRSVSLPNVTVKITGYTTDEDGDWNGWEWDAK